jgi:hypothetical protein
MTRLRHLSLLATFFLLIVQFGCKDEDDDPCEGVLCGDGYCDNGVCQCPEGFYGFRCNSFLIPTAVVLEGITIDKFPTTRVDSSSWDVGSNPDLHLTFFQSTTKLWETNSSIQDASTNSNLQFDVIPSVRMRNLDAQYTISLYDDDGNKVDEFMAGSLFKPYDEILGSVKNRTIDNGGDLVVTLTLSYEY